MTSHKSLQRVTDETQIIGKNIRILRKRAGYSQQKIAAVLDISFQQIQKYEAGKNRFPVEKLYRLRQFYNVPYAAFFEGLNDKDIQHPRPDISLSYLDITNVKDPGMREKIRHIVSILAT